MNTYGQNDIFGYLAYYYREMEVCMYKIGDYLVYKTEGVCKVNKITLMQGASDTKKCLYYVLSPIKNDGLTIYSPVDNPTVIRRPVMTAEEARAVVREAAELPPLDVPNEKSREDAYKRALKSGDCREWFRITKTIHTRKEYRQQVGKKTTAMDDHYFRAAQGLLKEELAVALDLTEQEVDEYIRSHMVS